MAQPKQLKAQISLEVFKLFGSYILVSTAMIVTLAFYGTYYYQKEEFKHYRSLISTKLGSEIKAAFQQAADLTQSTDVWTAMTDSVGRGNYLLPVLKKANQNTNYKFDLLDYRGREFISSDNTTVHLMDALWSVQETLKDNRTHFETLQIGEISYLVVSQPVMTNFTDSMVGIVLMCFDIDKTLADLQMPKDVQLHLLSGPGDETPLQFYQRRENFKLAWQAADQDYAIDIQVVQNHAPALLLILSGLVVSLVCGAFLFWRLKRWTTEFSVRTTSRLDSLVILATNTLQGRNTKSGTDTRGDEIAEVSNALQGILQKQRLTTQKLSVFSRVFETAAEAILITNTKGLIVDVNNALLEMTGYSKETLIGQHAGRLYLKEHSENDVSVIAQSVQKNGVWRGETNFLSKHKDPIPVILSVSTLRDSEGVSQGYVSVFSDISPMRKAEQQLKNLLLEDQLTQLPNYRRFLEYMNERIDGERFALLFIDLDNFKSINDTYGHDQGDEAIRLIAQHLQSVLPDGAFLCRRSGDEFIAVVTVSEHLEDFKKKLQLVFKPHAFNLHMAGSANLTATFSAGAAVFPDDSQKISELLIFADTALLSAKEAGRNQIKWLDLQMMKDTSRKTKIESKLALAISEGKIHPHYQPEVDLLTGNIIGFEALARWHDEELGHVSPTEFITQAEQSGAIAALTQSLFTQVVADRPVINDRFPGARIAFNSSPQLLAGKWLLTMLTTIANEAKHGLEGFVMEITESDLSLSAQEISNQLQAIMELGVTIAIDDFGRSYSSLSRLASMPIQKLKIDMSFTAGLDREENIKIVAGILALAQSLELEVTAEGVENDMQRDTLVRLGCLQAQGYLYAKPLPLKDVMALPRQLRPTQLT